MIESAYNLNNPLFVNSQTVSINKMNSFFHLKSRQVVMETVKKVRPQETLFRVIFQIYNKITLVMGYFVDKHEM